ncbi:MAG: glucokinase [Deltaproteobacteria bacterium]|jgi:glucokinase|nr:glucokinase [Deltaproteobacteria bacterium]
MRTRFLLAADIGGTNSRFALFRLEEEPCSGAPPYSPGGAWLSLQARSRVALPTAAHASFGHLLENLRGRKALGGFSPLGDFAIAALSLAVPGPVSGQGENQACRAPNIAWPILAADASRAGAAPATLLNDFAAQGLACLLPEALGLRTVLPGLANPTAPAVIIGAGTGLGKAIILPRRAALPSGAWVGAESPPTPFPAVPPGLDKSAASAVYLPYPGRREADLRLDLRIMPSEGGHSLFPFNGQEEADFQAFLRKKANRREVIGDMVVSGSGLAALYAYHAGLDYLPEPPEVTAKLDQQPQVLEWMARFYGRACRNLVLETLALGGVYLSGGLLSYLPGLRGHPAFAAEFRQSETHAATLRNVPVWWVSNQDSGLWGAALHGVNMLFRAGKSAD